MKAARESTPTPAQPPAELLPFLDALADLLVEAVWRDLQPGDPKRESESQTTSRNVAVRRLR
jgi:hypothetical protein